MAAYRRVDGLKVNCRAQTDCTPRSASGPTLGKFKTSPFYRHRIRDCSTYTVVSKNPRREAFEKCRVHSPLRAAARPFTRCRYCCTSHAACASMSTTITTTTTTR